MTDTPAEDGRDDSPWVEGWRAGYKVALARADAAERVIAAVEALIDPAAGMAQPLYGSRYFDEKDIRTALAVR